MSGRVVKRPQAKQDLSDEAYYPALDSPQASEWLLAGLRSWPIPGFTNYLIFYLPVEDGIEIIRVLHGARDIPRILDDEDSG